MEGRVAGVGTSTPHARARHAAPGRGTAAVALALILAISGGWWALALYPVGEAAPAWMLRTRAACFGSVGSGLPSAGGWVLLIGEPIGMIGTLVAVWGGALADDLRWLARRAWGRVTLAGAGVALALGGLAGAHRVARALEAGAPGRFEVRGVDAPVPRLDLPAAPLALTDQHGERFDLGAWRGQPVIVTFAFAHCADVCPTLVQQLRQARRAAGREQVPIVVVTLDPWRDVPARLPHIAREWALAEGDRLLGGSVAEVNGVLDAWGVGRVRDGKTGDISHAAVAFLVNSSGRVMARLDGGADRMRDLLREP